eukprot:8762651-Pyramimonas_sp.AAC.1
MGLMGPKRTIICPEKRPAPDAAWPVSYNLSGDMRTRGPHCVVLQGKSRGPRAISFGAKSMVA